MLYRWLPEEQSKWRGLVVEWSRPFTFQVRETLVESLELNLKAIPVARDPRDSS